MANILLWNIVSSVVIDRAIELNDLEITTYVLTLRLEIKRSAHSVIWHYLHLVDLFDTLYSIGFVFK